VSLTGCTVLIKMFALNIGSQFFFFFNEKIKSDNFLVALPKSLFMASMGVSMG
jgi:hypothetical protein